MVIWLSNYFLSTIATSQREHLGEFQIIFRILIINVFTLLLDKKLNIVCRYFSKNVIGTLVQLYLASHPIAPLQMDRHMMHHPKVRMYARIYQNYFF